MDLDFNLEIILPEAFLGAGVFVLTLLGLFLPARYRHSLIPLFTFSLVLISGGLIYFYTASGSAFYDLLLRNRQIDYTKLILLLGGAFTILISPLYLKKHNAHYFEFYIVLTVALIGAMISVSTHHYLSLLIGIETLSICSYIMCGVRRNDLAANEAALKYFISGAFSTAFIVFGIALMYGATGEVEFGPSLFPAGLLDDNQNTMLMAGGLFFIGGLAGKLAAAPLHFWAADVYQGAPLQVTAFLLVVPKVSLLTVLFNFLSSDIKFSAWGWAIILLSIFSMLVGNAMAIKQKNLKRLLAFSSIVQSGYLILLAVFYNEIGFWGLAYYLLAYLLASFGVMAVLNVLSTQKDVLDIEDIKGLFFKNPKLAVLLSFSLISLAGIPLTPGFLAKIMLIYQLAQVYFFGPILVLFVILSSVIAAVYYIKLIVSCFSSVSADASGLKINLDTVSVGLITIIISIWLILNGFSLFSSASF